MRRAAIAAAQVRRPSSRSSDELAYLKKGLEFGLCDEPSVMAQPDGSMTRMGFRSASCASVPEETTVEVPLG